MGGLSFLFDGKPPPSVTTYGTSSTNIPQWLSDYTQGLIGQANAVASQPYTPYQGPRIAGFTPEQQQAMALTEGNVGKYTGMGEGALSTTGNITGMASGMIPGAITNASKTYTGDTVNEYMNPYIDNVTKKAQELANRNFTETLMPQVQGMFTRAGQYGSANMADKMLKGTRDITEGLQSSADASLAQAYTSGASTFGADASRAGQLAQLGMTSGLAGAQQEGNLAQILQKMGLTDAASLDTVGANKQAQNQKNLDLAYSDFQNQQNFPKQNVDWLSNIIRGIPNQGSTTTTTDTKPYSGDMQPSIVSGLGSLLSLIKGVQDGD